MLPDDTPYTADELAEVFRPSVWTNAFSIECKQLAKSIVDAGFGWALADRFQEQVLVDIDNHAVPDEFLRELRDRLVAVSAEFGVDFVPPAEVRINIRPEREASESTVKVRATGGRISPDDHRVRKVKSDVQALTVGEADFLNEMVKGVKPYGVRLNLSHGTTELDLLLVQALIGLAPYDADVRTALVETVTYNEIDDLCATLVRMDKTKVSMLIDQQIAFMDGRLRLTFTSDGHAELCATDSVTRKSKEKTHVIS